MVGAKIKQTPSCFIVAVSRVSGSYSYEEGGIHKVGIETNSAENCMALLGRFLEPAVVVYTIVGHGH